MQRELTGGQQSHSTKSCSIFETLCRGESHRERERNDKAATRCCKSAPEETVRKRSSSWCRRWPSFCARCSPSHQLQVRVRNVMKRVWHVLFVFARFASPLEQTIRAHFHQHSSLLLLSSSSLRASNDFSLFRLHSVGGCAKVGGGKHFDRDEVLQNSLTRESCSLHLQQTEMPAVAPHLCQQHIFRKMLSHLLSTVRREAKVGSSAPGCFFGLRLVCVQISHARRSSLHGYLQPWLAPSWKINVRLRVGRVAASRILRLLRIRCEEVDSHGEDAHPFHSPRLYQPGSRLWMAPLFLTRRY
jgi:hypothetical protein